MCFSLYAVEAEVGESRTGKKGEDYHSFLLLRDETPGQDPQIVEELHFIMQKHGLAEGQKPFMHAVTKANTDRDFDALEKRGYIGGDADVMRHVWEEAINIGFEIGQLQKEFGKNSMNCRAGSKAVIDGLGLKYSPVIESGHVAMRGSDTNLISEIPERHFEL